MRKKRERNLQALATTMRCKWKNKKVGIKYWQKRKKWRDKK